MSDLCYIIAYKADFWLKNATKKAKAKGKKCATNPLDEPKKAQIWDLPPQMRYIFSRIIQSIHLEEQMKLRPELIWGGPGVEYDGSTAVARNCGNLQSIPLITAIGAALVNWVADSSAKGPVARLLVQYALKCAIRTYIQPVTPNSLLLARAPIGWLQAHRVYKKGHKDNLVSGLKHIVMYRKVFCLL